jgi:beta-hydroxylase
MRAIPGMKTAMFSILAAGKHIPPHRGPYKGVLRYHLGLIVPQPAEACRIRVGDEVRHWTEGGSLVFDDTYDHEVWNDTGGQRVVLFVDVVRPLTGAAAQLNRALLWLIARSPLVRDARRRQQRWTAAIAARQRAQQG